MKDKTICVFDVEANGLVEPTEIWVLSAAIFSKGKWRMKSTTDYDEMRTFFTRCDVIIGHNIIRWDIPHVERLLGIKIDCEVIDTLGVSWYISPFAGKHGLGSWGEEFGVPKPVITDGEWLGALEGETQEEFIKKMTHRCEQDVRINCMLYDKQMKDLRNLYQQDDKAVDRLIKYMMYKMDMAREAERSRWRLDVDKALDMFDSLTRLKEEKEQELKEAMPKVPQTKVVSKPTTLYKAPKSYKRPATYLKKNGELSSAGQRYKDICDSIGIDPEKEESVTVPSHELTAHGVKWVEALETMGLPESHTEPIELFVEYKDGNPNSPQQIKDWLTELGWVPQTFLHTKDSEGNPKQVPQVRYVKKGEKRLCPSVVELFEKEPALEILEGLSVITHRLAIFKGFIDNCDSEGYIKAQMQGFTNTLRLKHRVLVNLPSVDKPYGKDIRGCLIAPEGYELLGSDMSSLEDRTKQHYMWSHDPEYVKEMQTEDFDPHLDLAVVAGFITEEQAQAHKDGTENHSGVRHKAKTANYACVYGASGETVARGAGMSKSEGVELVKKYWERNWSVNAIAAEQVTKDCLGSMWLLNPVSKFWYSLRYEKDIFSTLNQGTGVYCFDVWIKNIMAKRPQLTGQFHDEIILTVKKGEREQLITLLKEAIQKTNKQLKLNRGLDVDIQFGDSYAEIH